MATLQLKPRLMLGSEIAVGPGKAALLEAIATHGSISAAARALGMSYRRAWSLVEVMNRCWVEPVIKTAAGGKSGGGAHLTAVGIDVLSAYRALDARLTQEAASAREFSTLVSKLKPDIGTSSPRRSAIYGQT